MGFSNMWKAGVYATAFMALAWTGCDNANTLVESADEEAQVANKSLASWDYSEGEHGPAHWAEMFPAFCAGNAQSPVDIVGFVEKSLPTLKFKYKPAVTLDVYNNGHTIQANVPAGSKLKISGKVFNLLQFHFHTPSEHTVEGGEYPLEVHLVHKAADGKLAVVGVFFEEGDENLTLKKMWNKHLREVEDNSHSSLANFNLSGLLPEEHLTYRYSGSLTTPTCDEIVSWNVMQLPTQMSAEQLEKIAHIFSGEHFPDGNRRPVQPLNGRKIKADA